MAIFTKPKLLFIFFLILSLVLVSQCYDQNPRGYQDPQEKLRECQQRCERQQPGQQKQLCKQRCEQQYRKEQQQQHGGETGEDDLGNRGPDKSYKRLQECQRRCQSEQQGQRLQECQQRCQQEYRREKGQHQGETNPQWEQQEKSNNPYLFESQRFRSRFRASHGDFRILERFNQRSQLLRGIEKYRVAILELEPQSFVLPHHCDGEAIYVVVKGQGVINIAEQDNKNSFNLQKGDVIRVFAGSNVYLLNKDNNERLFVYVLAKSVNAPGNLQEYFSAGGQNPESFYRAFSSDILESAFNNPRDRLERLFGQHKEGIIIKASEEQIRAISEHASRSTQQTRGRTQGPFNLLKERPVFESRFGQFFEARPERYEQLRDLDAAVGFMNINQGGMVLPYYNTKSTKLVMVVEGNARFEMACPHLGRQSQSPWSRGQGREREQEQEQEQEEGDVHYQKIRGNLNVGDVLVIPAGHPITFVATGNSNLRIVGFGVDAENNKKNFLAGKQNIWRNIDREAKELSFSMPGREVEEIFQRQDQSYFVAGPEHRQQRERGEEGRRGQDQYLSSILDFVF
ncbi:vicilin GC72-A-like [Solanum pennellii]|uniref:Vicilin GC72-A-like n=1 Tax=Solanum pennellii TaxID=28526 RepID=A0ABM1HJY8_SOLPN|nr:vicilin GC72-A-like [Solanum pennellii]